MFKKLIFFILFLISANFILASESDSALIELLRTEAYEDKIDDVTYYIENIRLNNSKFINIFLGVPTFFEIHFRDIQSRWSFCRFANPQYFPGAVVFVNGSYVKFVTIRAITSYDLLCIIQSLINALDINDKIVRLDIGI